MARPATGQPRKQHYRRWITWSPEMTTLVERAAQLVDEKEIYFPYRLEWGGRTNLAGVVQGVILSTSKHLAQTTPDEWLAIFNRYLQFEQTQQKEIHLDDKALAAFHAIGNHLTTVKPPEAIKLLSRGEYHYPTIIAAALIWFTDHHK